MPIRRGWSLSVELPAGQSGAIGQILGRLADAKVTVEGSAKAGTALHVLAPDPVAAGAALRGLGLEPIESEVLVIGLGNEPGAVSRVLRRFTDAGLHVTFMYLASTNRIVIGADELDALAAAVQDMEPL